MLLPAAAPLCAASLPGFKTPPQPAARFDRAAWKSDLQRIERGLAQGYANFDWQIEKRGFNPMRADQQLNAMLDQATSDAEAVVILSKLMDALRDPHLQLLPGPPPPGATLLPRARVMQVRPFKPPTLAASPVIPTQARHGPGLREVA